MMIDKLKNIPHYSPEELCSILTGPPYFYMHPVICGGCFATMWCKLDESHLCKDCTKLLMHQPQSFDTDINHEQG